VGIFFIDAVLIFVVDKIKK